jgi:DNA polymerase IV
VGEERRILHLDLDAFFCAVEELQDPSLVGKAFGVGGRPDERGVIASCSYPARRKGVHSAMPTAQAVKLCPGLLVLPTRHSTYGKISREVMQRLHELTPLVEQVSIDEAFVDVSSLAGDSESLARALQQRIRSELGLPCSLGAATNKLVAKIANDVGKSRMVKSAEHSGGPPNAITVVPAGEEEAFLAPLGVQALWGVGPKTAARLAELGITTIGELAQMPAPELASRFGKHGTELALRARGIDERPIVTEHEVKSVSQETTFVRDLRDEAALRRSLAELAAGVGKDLRRESLCCQTVKIKIKWPDFTIITRQMTLPAPTDQDAEILRAAEFLFLRAWDRRRPVRLLGVGASSLGPPLRQLRLWE